MIDITKLYLDLDGVFADFNKRATEVFDGQHPKFDLGLSDNKMWPRLKACEGGFFNSLEWIPGSRRLWNFVKIYDPTILTGAPYGNWAEPQKRLWINREMGAYEAIVCLSKEKCQYANSTSLLIDDREKNVNDWIECGGHAILHVTVNQTLEELKEYTFN